MKVVLPIMTRHEEAWKTPEGREITRQFLVMAEALDHDAVVATDDAVVADLAQTLDLPVLPVEEDAVSTAWPPGTQDAVKQVRASEDGPLLILDFRNPLLRSDHVVQAVASFRESGDPVLASVVKIRDLPCQFKLCLDLAQTVAINPLDPDFTPPSPYQSLNATRAIPMAWEGANVTKNNYYVREAGVFGSRYKPDDGQRDEPDTPVWLFENPGNGRIVFRREHDSTGYVWPQGFPVFDCRGPSLKDGRYTLKFIRRLNDSRRYYFKLSLIRETGAVSLKGMGELLGPDRRELTLRFDDLGAYCILVHIYEVVDRGIYELQEPFCPSEADWAFDSRLRGKNLVTGKSIQGRQEVSETYDLDSSIVILAPGADLPTRAETLLATGFRPFVLDSAESVHLHSRLDFVRYKAKKRLALHGQ